jgi:uncharacterized protein
MRRILTGLLLALLLSSAAAQDLAPIPPLKTRVTDQIGMLQPEQRAALEKTLQEHEAKTGNQVAVLLIKTTEPEAIEQYSIRVAEAWKLGRKGVDDGVILIISKENRKTRLEVGRGAEGVITDAMSKRILQDVIAPHFRQNDFYGGLNAGVTAIHALLNKEAFPSAPMKQANKGAQNDSVSGFLLMQIAFMIFIMIWGIWRHMRSPNSNGWGSSSSGIFIGGSSGWSSGSSSSDSGGFSGGGGDFGGGGASGDW